MVNIFNIEDIISEIIKFYVANKYRNMKKYK